MAGSPRNPQFPGGRGSYPHTIPGEAVVHPVFPGSASLAGEEQPAGRGLTAPPHLRGECPELHGEGREAGAGPRGAGSHGALGPGQRREGPGRLE